MTDIVQPETYSVWILGHHQLDHLRIQSRKEIATNPENFSDAVSTQSEYHEDFQNKSEQELLNSNFKYVNLNIEGNGNFDVLEILTSGVIIDFMKTEEIWKKYQKRKSFSNIEAAVEDLKLDKIDFDEFYNKINEIVTAYFNLYRNVPNISLRNKIIDLVSSKLEQYQYIINDNNELLNSENSLLSIYKIEKEDSIKIKKEVSKLLKEIDSDVIKNDINKFLQHIETKRLKESEKKEREISEKIIEIKNSVEELDKMVNELNYLLLLFNKKEKDHSIDNEFETKKYFDIESLNENKYAEKQEQELIDEILNGKNVVIFEESIYLSDIPNDKSFVDKINKFLGDGNFSITSQKFMKDNSMSGEFVEKYEDHRSKIWSRREDRTPVRVYFIPIYTKFFACYYVTGVNYKDDSHVDAGCKNDKVYNLRVKEAKIIEEKINSFNSIDEVIEFINQSKKDYEEVMKPIMMKKKKK